MQYINVQKQTIYTPKLLETLRTIAQGFELVYFQDKGAMLIKDGEERKLNRRTFAALVRFQLILKMPLVDKDLYPLTAKGKDISECLKHVIPITEEDKRWIKKIRANKKFPYRHIKRGAIYVIVGFTRDSTTKQIQVLFEPAGNEFAEERVPITRPASEFFDGRFEQIRE